MNAPITKTAGATAVKKSAKKSKAPKRERVILTAEQWVKKLKELEKLPPEKRREVHKKTLFQLSNKDIRDQGIAMFHKKFGHGEAAYERLHAAGGVYPATMKSWEDGKVDNPHMTSHRKNALAMGIKFGYYE